MKRLVLLAVLATTAQADEYVNGYFRQDGQYVEGYYRTNPNTMRWDNYSSQGNENPYTREKGYQRNEYTDPPEYNRSQPRMRGGRPSSYR